MSRSCSVFSPDFVKKYAGKVLMMPGPAWYAGAIFNNPQSLKSPPDSSASPRRCRGRARQAVTGNVGGGTWLVSSHSKNLKAAEHFVEFVTTADDYQVDRRARLPGLRTGRDKWIAKQESSGYFATDHAAGGRPLRSQVWDGWGSRQLQPGGDLGQDGHPGDHRRSSRIGRSAADLADGDREPGQGQRIQGQ